MSLNADRSRQTARHSQHNPNESCCYRPTRRRRLFVKGAVSKVNSDNLAIEKKIGQLIEESLPYVDCSNLQATIDKAHQVDIHIDIPDSRIAKKVGPVRNQSPRI